MMYSSKLSGAAKGLEYLHSSNVIHGNGKQTCLVLQVEYSKYRNVCCADSQMCKDAGYYF